MKILARLQNSKDFWFLLTLGFVFFLLRFPSLFEPYWYGDEGIYQTVGMGIRDGRLLYRDIWDNKPPLLYLLYAIFSSDQFLVRLVSLIFGLGAVLIFFALSKKLFANKNLSYFTTLIFATLFALPLLEGNIANAENFMLLPIILAAFLIFKAGEAHLNKKPLAYLILFTAGLLLSFAFLFKVVAIFDFTAFLLFILFINFPSKISFQKILNRRFIYFAVGFLIPILSTLLFFLIKGAFSAFLNATLSQNVGYVNYGNRFLTPGGLLFIKLLFLISVTFFLFLKRELLKPPTLFILLWFSFSFFNAFFSQRPYTHYLLVLLPSFSLFIGLILGNKNYQKIALVIFVIILLLIFRNFSFFNKSAFYYQNFISFMRNQKSFSSYSAFFDRNTPVDYKIAQFLKARLNDNETIFVWGNNAQLYKLIGKVPPTRFIVAYHITASKKTLKETGDALRKAKPKYLVFSLKESFPYNLTGYTQRIIIDDVIIYECIF